MSQPSDRTPAGGHTCTYHHGRRCRSAPVSPQPPRMARWYVRLLRTGFHLLYNQLAWSYDLVAKVVSFGQWQAWGEVSIPFLRGPRVLDLAHGPGNLLPALVEAGFDPVGYDLSPAMGRIARRKLARKGLSVPLARGMAQQLPFATGAFDSVVCTFPAEFILSPYTLSEIRRVLRDDGTFVLIPIATLTGRGSRVLERLYRITGQRPSGVSSPPPQLEKAGFRSELTWVPLPQSQVMVILNYPSNSTRRATGTEQE